MRALGRYCAALTCWLVLVAMCIIIVAGVQGRSTFMLLGLVLLSGVGLVTHLVESVDHFKAAWQHVRDEWERL